MIQRLFPQVQQHYCSRCRWPWTRPNGFPVSQFTFCRNLWSYGLVVFGDLHWVCFFSTSEIQPGNEANTKAVEASAPSSLSRISSRCLCRWFSILAGMLVTYGGQCIRESHFTFNHGSQRQDLMNFLSCHLLFVHPLQAIDGTFGPYKSLNKMLSDPLALNVWFMIHFPNWTSPCQNWFSNIPAHVYFRLFDLTKACWTCGTSSWFSIVSTEKFLLVLSSARE